MHQDTHGWVTVHDVARDMGLVMSNSEAWAVGKAMEQQWLYFVGTPPLKDIRAKKSGIGSHCFALYPPTKDWRDRIARKIKAVRAETAAQTSFWDSL